MEGVDALQDQHVPGVDDLAGIGTAVVGVVIALPGDGLPGQQRLDILKQQVMIENAGFVIIQQHPLLEGERRVVEVIGVLLHDQATLAQMCLQAFRQGGFSAAAGAANADEQHGAYLLKPFLS